jgi:hypothetical protein
VTAVSERRGSRLSGPEEPADVSSTLGVNLRALDALGVSKDALRLRLCEVILRDHAAVAGGGCSARFRRPTSKQKGGRTSYPLA